MVPVRTVFIKCYNSYLIKQLSSRDTSFSFVDRLKWLSEKGLRFAGDKSKTIGQPTPVSHPHLMEGNESK